MAKTGRKAVTQIPKDETNAARFLRVVTPRVNKAIKAIKVVGYCAASNYEYTDKQVFEIIDALTNATTALDDRFAKKQDKQAGFGFKP